MEGIDWSRLITIIVGIVALIAGWALGFFDSKMRADKKIREANEKAEIAVRQAKGEVERAVMASRAVAEAAPSRLPGITLLRLWLDSNERPNLDLDGQRVETAPISEPNRKRLINLFTVMRPWIEGRLAASTPAAQVVPPAPAVAPQPVSPAPVAPSLIPSLPKKEEKIIAAPLSIVAQIDEVLQARLASTTFAGRGIRLQESPEGGVIVWVGTQKFPGVADVTDPEIQAIIRTAISEWEKKYTPGL